MRVDRTRLLFELPFFMVYLSAYHVSARSIHDVFAHLVRTTAPRLLGEVRKVASVYLRIFADSRDTVRAILATASALRVRELEVFLRSYAAALVSRGGVQPVIERGLESSIRALDTLVSSRLDIILSAVEAIAVASTILVFTIAFIPVNQGLSLLLSLVLSILMLSLAIALRLPLLDVYIGKPSRMEVAAGYVYVGLALATGTIILFTPLPPFSAMLVAATPIPLAIHFLVKWHRLLRLLDRDIESTTLVLDNLQLGTTSLRTLVKNIQQALEDKAIITSVVFGREPRDKHTNILEYSANLITILLMSGARSAQTAFMFSLVLDRVRALQRLLNTRALVYEAIVFASLIGLVALTHIATQTLESMTLPYNGEPLTPLPVQGLSTDYVAQILYLPALTAILAISKITRGAPFYTPLPGILPLSTLIMLMLSH